MNNKSIKNSTISSTAKPGLVGFVKKYSKVFLALSLLVVAGFVLRNIVVSQAKTEDVKGVMATKEINKDFNFIARDAQGYFTDASIKMNVSTIQKQEEVLIKGNRATARNGKVFLIMEISLQNDTNQPLYLNPLDLVRLVDSDGSKIAPQVHQGNVEVRPQSTKKSNIGFIVEQDRKDFNIQVGELEGDKESLTVKF